MDYFLVAIFGFAIGSFVNSLVYRLNEGEKIFSLVQRSICPHCRHILSWRDLFPLLSFLWLRGRCRFCGAPISVWYFIGEVMAALFFVLIWWYIRHNLFYHIGFGMFFYFATGYLFLTAALLAGIFQSDLRYRTIPDVFSYVLSGSTLLFLLSQTFLHLPRLFSGFHPLFPDGLIGAAAIGSFFAFLILVSGERWMGWGDAKYGVFMGLFLGIAKGVAALYMAFVGGALVGILLILMRRKTLKSEIPFGVFLVPVTLFAFLWGDILWCKIWPC